MKKIITAVLLLSVILVLSSCGKESETPTPTPTPSESAATDSDTELLLEYFATKENTVYVYDGVEEDFTAWNVFNDYVYLDKGIIQRKIEASGHLVCELIRFSQGQAIVYYSATKYNYLEFANDKPQNTNYLVLKTPFEKGAKWLMDEAQGGLIHCEITDMEAEVTVPAGTFTAMEVKTTYDDSETTYQLQYYAKGIGLVKQVTVTDTKTYLTELSDIIEDAAMSQDIIFFFPSYEADELDYEIRTCSFGTNTDILDFFNLGFSAYDNKENNLFNDNTGLISITMDFPNNLATVNLSKEFASAMTGSDEKKEKMILDSIAYTFAVYYGTERVQMLLEGEPYVSANITMEKDELWEMNAVIKSYEEQTNENE